MLVSDFDYELPPELIAQHPPSERDGARMLHLDRHTGCIEDGFFRDLTTLLRPGDVVVFNNSRVIPSRLYGRRGGLRTQAKSEAPSGVIEVLLTEQVSDHLWNALVKPGRKVQRGETLHFGRGETTLTAEVVEQSERGHRTLRFSPVADFFTQLEALGHIPLPPYLHRADTAEDRVRYQTVYADPAQPGSAAAPTAGLHFTPQILDTIRRFGVETAYVTLHVGLGTFQPVSAERVEDIRLHAEHYTLSAGAASAINLAKAQGRRVIAVGTTTVRTLEHCARQAIGSSPAGPYLPLLHPHSGSTSIFLKPGDRFHLVDALLTNFHLPKSTLTMLVAAFAAQGREPQAGMEFVMSSYHHAVRERYRFFSYGDCMFIT